MFLLALPLAHAAGTLCPTGRLNPITYVCERRDMIGPKNTGNLTWWQIMALAEGLPVSQSSGHVGWDGWASGAAFNLLDALNQQKRSGDLLLTFGDGSAWHATVARGPESVGVFWSYHPDPAAEMAYGALYTGYELANDGQGTATWLLTSYTLYDLNGVNLGSGAAWDVMTFAP